ncbi:MAG: tetratricopeptide repeat protein [Nibricoccus sp.]
MASARQSPPKAPLAPAEPDRFSRRWWLVLGAVALLVLISVAYRNSLGAPFIFDDADSILNNLSIRSFVTAFLSPSQSGITVSGRPVLNLSFAINYAVNGATPAGVRWGNILIHGLAALTLWGVIRRTLKLPLLSGRCGTDATWLAWLAASLWALHPIQTESVSYAVQRAESLVGLFYVLTLYCFLRYVVGGHKGWAVISVFACALGMGTKEVMATAPVVIFLYDRTFVSSTFREAWRRHKAVHLCHAATLLILAALTFSTHGRGGTVGADASVTHWNYLCTQAYALVRYLRLCFWPSDLTLDYGTLIVSDPLIVAVSGGLTLAALGATIWAVLKNRSRGFLGAWFFCVLAPSSSFIPVNTQTMAEHRVYLALAAIIVAALALAHRFVGKWSALLVIFIPVATFATISRNSTYQSELAIWQDTVSKRPDNHRAWISLGNYRLHKEKKPAEAASAFRRGLALKPNQPEGLNGLGQTMIKLGQPREGLELVAKSLALAPNNYSVQAGAGSAYMDAGLYEEALPHLLKALESNPTSSNSNYNLGNALMKLGRDAEAEQRFRLALEHNSDDLDILNNLGTLLRRNGRLEEAIGCFKRAIAIKPDSSKAHNNLGIAYLLQGNAADGIKHLREAVRLEPESFESRANLAHALAQLGQFSEAITLCEGLVREKPDPELYNNLGVLLGQAGELQKARMAFRSALQLDPNHPSAKDNLQKLEAFLRANSGR